MDIHPQKIEGLWQFGVAIDFHTTSSTPTGPNQAGHMQFETVRPPIAELLYRLKYLGDRRAADGIIQAAAAWLSPHRAKLDVLVPVPPSTVRQVQPVLLLANGLGAAAALPVANCITTTRSPAALKAIEEPARRETLLNGLYQVDTKVHRAPECAIIRRYFSLGCHDERDYQTPSRSGPGRQRPRSHHHAHESQALKSVFLGGSRAITRLPPALEERLGNIVAHKLAVILGDAAGADKAMQAFFHALPYRDVTIFHAGHTPRHNLGHWPANAVPAPRASSGFQFYAEKDRAMARAADYGLMLWDGKSPGTALNILRLTRAGKPAILMNMANRSTITFKSAQDWQNFLADQNASLHAALSERMMADENIPEPPQTRERHASEPAAALTLLP